MYEQLLNYYHFHAFSYCFDFLSIVIYGNIDGNCTSLQQIQINLANITVNIIILFSVSIIRNYHSALQKKL